ncbi:MAG: hypothetical protein BWY11_01498 [Firmicutes bacterium ADurb.Bin182]|nr:MAG: hypothetical protein BWY11_01498 [Firmicutes bacterium ADurb.Bin182]
MFRYTGISPVIGGLLLGAFIGAPAFLGFLPKAAVLILIALSISALILFTTALLLARVSLCTDGMLRNCLCRFGKLLIAASGGALILALIMLALGPMLCFGSIVFAVLIFLLFLLLGTALITFVLFLFCQLCRLCKKDRFEQ